MLYMQIKQVLGEINLINTFWWFRWLINGIWAEHCHDISLIKISLAIIYDTLYLGEVVIISAAKINWVLLVAEYGAMSFYMHFVISFSWQPLEAILEMRRLEFKKVNLLKATHFGQSQSWNSRQYFSTFCCEVLSIVYTTKKKL